MLTFMLRFSPTTSQQCSCLQDDLRAPGLDAATQAEVEAEQSAATAEVQRATQAEGLSRRMGQAAQDELRRLEAEVAEERVSFQEFEPWFAEHEPQLHPEGLLFEKFVSAATVGLPATVAATLTVDR